MSTQRNKGIAIILLAFLIAWGTMTCIVAHTALRIHQEEKEERDAK